VVSPGYFETMRIPLVEGRYLDDRDRMDAPLAMVVNREFVSRYLAGRDPIGRQVVIGGSDPASQRYRIVGIVENVHHNGLTREVKAQFYVTIPQFATAPGNTTRSFNLVVRTEGDPLALANAVRGVIRRIDPRIPVSGVRTMDDVVAASIAQPRFAMALLGLFGVLALLLSAVGIFGIVAQLVAARSHEFGIRAALGASPRNLVLLSMRGGLVQTLVGLVTGIAAALVLTRAMQGLLEGVTPTDPLTFVTVVMVTGAVALVATLGPARRASRVDPMTTLHEG
jgi:putative ABC transport system permease protein